MKIIALCIPVVLVFLAQLRKKSKMLALILCFYMWLIYSFNTYNGDFWNYYTIYNFVRIGVLKWHFEPLYSILMQLCAFTGMNYFGFKATLGLIYILLLYKLFSCYSKAPTLALSLFLIFPFLHNVSVLRAGISGLIVCLAFCRYTEKRSHAKARYLAGILVASMFHYSSFFFAVMVLFEKIKKPKRVFAVSALLSAVLMFTIYSGIALRVLGIITARVKSLQWLSAVLSPHLNVIGMTCVALIFVGNYVLSRLCLREIRHYSSEDNQKYLVLANRVNTANCALFIVLPFALMTDVLLCYVFEFMGVNICTFATASVVRSEHRNLRWEFSYKRFILLLWVFLLLIYTTLPYLKTDISAFHSLYNNLAFGQKVPF